jgi:hypothetical protein
MECLRRPKAGCTCVATLSSRSSGWGWLRQRNSELTERYSRGARQVSQRDDRVKMWYGKSESHDGVV